MQLHRLTEFINLLQEAELLKETNINENDTLIQWLTYDSNDAKEGTLFVCKGAHFKAEYLASAINKGAVCYVSEVRYDAGADEQGDEPETSGVPAGFPYILVNDIRKAMPYLSDFFFDSPSKELKLTGITGTKGKSTTAYYIKNILDLYEQSKGGKVTAITSSIDMYDGVQEYESHITTPENMELQYHFRNAADSGIEYFTMEVSSQALKYDRVDRIRFDAGIFMNISEDHISDIEHPTFEDYFKSKLRIFNQSEVSIINIDADQSETIVYAAQKALKRGNTKKIITFGIESEENGPESAGRPDILGYGIEKRTDGIYFKVKCDRFDRRFVLTMPGLFNVENALAAIAVANLYDIPEKYIYEGLRTARSKGRMELFTSKDGKVSAIVDYAHNKLSFEKLYESTVSEYPGQKIVTIFGCPGYKAYQRREHLGTLSGRYSDKVYLVAEDPGEEPVEQISRDIAQYVEREGCPYEMIEDRGEAIGKAIMEVKEPTVILITGKGDETRQKYGREYLDCPSDADYTRQFIAKYDSEHS